MTNGAHRPSRKRLVLFGPPYNRFRGIGTDWSPASLPPRGLAVVWWLENAAEQAGEFAWLRYRPHGLPLMVVLPPPDMIPATIPILHELTDLSPRAVLPSARVASPPWLRNLLAMPPRPVADGVTRYLAERGLLRSAETRREVAQILAVAPEVKSISQLAKRLYTSRRTLGRHFLKAGLPVPSHWLQFSRLIHASMRLQNDSTAILRIAMNAGYPDGFTLSNQMQRLFGFRPTEVRRCAGWEWVIEAWIRMEARGGGIDPDQFGEVIAPYILPRPRKRRSA